jgi:uncharacterized RDD family membrane protein YckC
MTEPSGIDAPHKLAYTPWFKRAGAALIDFAPVIILVIVYQAVAAASGLECPPSRPKSGVVCDVGPHTALWKFNVAIWLAIAAYTLLNVYLQGKTGSTIGKAVFKFKVVSAETGQPIGFWRALRRFSIRPRLLPRLDNPQRQSYVDKRMGTICVPR